MKNKKAICVCIMCASLTGCSLLASPMEKPILEDHSGNLGTFATVAERRMVVTKKDYGKVGNNNPYDSKFCSEPPPDATQSIASALTAALSGSAAGTKAKPEVSVEFAKSLETTAKTLFQRSQGVQLFRDGLYNLCQAHLNGAITGSEYSTHYTGLLNVASGIINNEVAKMPSVPVLRAEEAATASEAAKNAAIQAKVSVTAAQAEIETSLRKAQAAAKEATESKKAAEISQASLDAAVRKAEDAAERAEEAAK